MNFKYDRDAGAEFDGLEMTLKAGEHFVEFVFPTDPESDPVADMERIGAEALYSLVQHLAAMGFIRGFQKGGGFVEVAD
jgi:hypothetical protein